MIRTLRTQQSKKYEIEEKKRNLDIIKKNLRAMVVISLNYLKRMCYNRSSNY